MPNQLFSAVEVRVVKLLPGAAAGVAGAITGNDAGAEPGFGPGHTLGSVVLHELCHAMNLSHVEVQSELMFPVATTLTPPLFGLGDEMGVWLLGVGRGART